MHSWTVRFALTSKRALCTARSMMIDVKAIRTQLKWSQGQMADYLGVDRSTVSRLENGQEASGPIRRLIELLPTGCCDHDDNGPYVPPSVPDGAAPSQGGRTAPVPDGAHPEAAE